MNSVNLRLVLQFIGILLLQVVVLNGIDFFGVAQPMLLVLFLFSYPPESDHSFGIFLAFLLGLVADSFSDTLALNALGLTIAAYFRPQMLRFCYGSSIEYHSDNKKQGSTGQHSYFLFLLLVIHHLVFFLAESFDLSRAFVILKQLAIHLPLNFVVGWLLIQLFSLHKH